MSTAEKRRCTEEEVVLVGPGGPWHASAPRFLRTNYQLPDDARGWTAWRKHLAGRKRLPARRLLQCKRSPLSWHLPTGRLPSTVELVDTLAKSQGAKSKAERPYERLAHQWLEQLGASPQGLDLAVGCLAWSDALASLGAHLSERTWWNLLNALAAEAVRTTWNASDPLVSLLLAGELPLTLAYSFPELASCRNLIEPAREAYSVATGELLDGEGLIRADHLPWFRGLLASLTRSRAIGAAIDKLWIEQGSLDQFPEAVQHVLRLSRTDGRSAFSDKDSEPLDAELVAAAVRLADDPPTRRVARLATAGQTVQRQPKDLPSPSFEGEWAATAMLRAHWRPSAPRLTVVYPAQVVQTELALGKDLLWSGNWDLEVSVDGQQVAPEGSWEQVCWVSDDDVDYLELTLRMQGNVRVERHIALARRHSFLFLADAILGCRQATLEYRGRLPLAESCSFAPEQQTREGMLAVRGKSRARVLPLALGEWRSAACRGRLEQSDHGLELRQSAHGQRLFAPLFVDLDARRLRREVTWRQLTVAENRELIPADMAVGYRVQAGRRQWLVYRSLGEVAVRSVLGSNLMHELMVAEFRDDGSVERIVEIEDE
jgi:hypothetical protein